MASRTTRHFLIAQFLAAAKLSNLNGIPYFNNIGLALRTILRTYARAVIARRADTASPSEARRRRGQEGAADSQTR